MKTVIYSVDGNVHSRKASLFDKVENGVGKVLLMGDFPEIADAYKEKGADVIYIEHSSGNMSELEPSGMQEALKAELANYEAHIEQQNAEISRLESELAVATQRIAELEVAQTKPKATKSEKTTE